MMYHSWGIFNFTLFDQNFFSRSYKIIVPSFALECSYNHHYLKINKQENEEEQDLENSLS